VKKREKNVKKIYYITQAHT